MPFFTPDLLRRTFVRSYNRANKGSRQEIFQTNVRFCERMRYDPESDQAATGGSRLHRSVHSREGLRPYRARGVPEFGALLPFHRPCPFEGA